ncbi:hypothetical protein [Kitasatospora sp. NPDC047058]|uniref:hypothetical protein n=1 Tax=Kitasatospora sp. NPDC047058 TaxID=3155620 RepID=UPI0033C1B09A
MEWINPRYAQLVACYRQQQETPDSGAAAFGVPLRRVDGEPVPARLGFVMEPSADE